MRKRNCFLGIGFLLLSVSGHAADYFDLPSSSTPRLSYKIPAKLNEVRAHYQLLPASSYPIPSSLQTGRAPIPSHLKEWQDIEVSTLKTLNFFQFIKENPLTPSQIDQLITAEKWQEFLEETRLEGQHLSFKKTSLLSEEEKEQLENSFRQHAQWQYMKIFMSALHQALPVIPPSFYEQCPAAFIVNQQFSPQDTPYQLALKFERLGLQIKDEEEKLSFHTRHFLMGEAFQQAGYYFFQTAVQSSNVFEQPELFMSAGLCLGWSAMHCEGGKAGIMMESAQQAMRQSYQALAKAFAAHRQQTTLSGRPQNSEFAAIKEHLHHHTTSLIKWVQDYDSEFYQRLLSSVKKGSSSSSFA